MRTRVCGGMPDDDDDEEEEVETKTGLEDEVEGTVNGDEGAGIP